MMMKRLLLALVFVLIGWPTVAQAQAKIAVNVPFTVSADSGDAGGVPVGFRCYIDSTKVGPDLPLTARVGGKVTCPFPGQTAGTHNVQLSAFDGFGENKSVPFTVTTSTGPTAPTNLQIVMSVVVNADGTAELTAFNVTKSP